MEFEMELKIDLIMMEETGGRTDIPRREGKLYPINRDQSSHPVSPARTRVEPRTVDTKSIVPERAARER